MEKKYIKPFIKELDAEAEEQLMSVSGDNVTIEGTASGNDGLSRGFSFDDDED